MWNHFSFLQLPFLSSRAVQLGSLYVRGLSHLLGANCASGDPLPKAALMPWHSFDGRLFHLKYLLAHSSVEKAVLLESDVSANRLTKKEILCAAVCVQIYLYFVDIMQNNFPLFLPFQSSLSLFCCLREKLIETCRKQGRILESRPNKPEQGHKATPGSSFRGRSTGW